MSYNEQLISIANDYFAEHEGSATSREIAAWAMKTGKWAPQPGSMIERCLHVEDRLFGRLEDGVEAAQNGHGEYDVTVLPTNVQVPEDIVGNAPDEIGDPVQLTLFHIHSPRVSGFFTSTVPYRWPSDKSSEYRISAPPS